MTSFWTDERISRTVSPGYVVQTLGSRYAGKLRQLLPHGEGLTELSYLEFTVERCPRLFLVLAEIGCPENIFGAIENNLDDGELPIPDLPGAMDGLALRNPATVRKFQRLQHAYHVQELEEGAQMHFGDADVVPISVMPRAKASLPVSFDRVTVKGLQMWRRTMPLRPDGGFGKLDFDRKYILFMQRVKHLHLTTIWATYTFQSKGYLLLQPYVGVTLESFMNDTPKAFKQLPFSQQRTLVTHWMQCLTAALRQLHDFGVPHRAVRPSNIFIDDQFHVWLGPYQALGAGADEQAEDAFKKEIYDHAPPEQYQTRHKVARREGNHVGMQGGGRTRRRVTQAPSGLSLNLDRSSSLSTTSSPHSEGSVAGTVRDTMSPTGPSGSHNRFLERPSTGSSAETVKVSVSVINYAPIQPQKGWHQPTDSQFFPSDIFSLTTVLIKLVSFVASLATPSSSMGPSKIPEYLGKTRSNAGRGGAVPDRSFHANLGQVDAWLDKVEKVIGRSSEKPSRMISLVRKSNTSKEEDPDKERWQATFTELISLLRHGFLKDPDRRWSAAEGFSAMNSVFHKWELPPSPCCGAAAESACDYASSDARSPSLRPWSSYDGSNRPPSLGHTAESSADTNSQQFELSASQYDPATGRPFNDYDRRSIYTSGYDYEPTRPARGPMEAMYDDSISIYSDRQESAMAETLHMNDMKDWPSPPPGRHPAFRAERRMPVLHEPVYELPGSMRPQFQRPQAKLAPPYHQYSYRPPPDHDLPPIPTDAMLHSRREPRGTGGRGRYKSDEMDDLTDSVQQYHLRRAARRG